MKKYALLSVYDKDGIVEFAKVLNERGYTLLSTGGTARMLRGARLPVRDVSAYTGFPEIMDGRLKTLHPLVHGGILGRRNEPTDLSVMAEQAIAQIDLVVVNLYPFTKVAARPDATREELIEQIDIGGPTMIRSAAKNHLYVTVVVDPNDYARVLSAMDSDGRVPFTVRRQLAKRAFLATAAYDTAIVDNLTLWGK